jgi:hypothetical protein
MLAFISYIKYICYIFFIGRNKTKKGECKILSLNFYKEFLYGKKISENNV